KQRVWALMPEKRFSERIRVPSDQPTGNWFVRYQTLARRRSWPMYAILIAIYGAVLWLLTPRSLEASLLQWFLFACFAVGIAFLIYGAALKAREPAT
ncbi:MAG TPA: hypothetical protein VM055_04990, partial [Novosphingobium sp.]|nr:hypothetical protein [Novosphingobium sp.]